MNRSALAISICTLLAVLVMTASCSSDADDANADECCPISEERVCNFLAGGAKSLQPGGGGQCIGVVYDAAPSTKSIDAKGCPVWGIGPACGAVSHYDAGGDSSSDAADEDSYVPPLEQDAESP